MNLEPLSLGLRHRDPKVDLDNFVPSCLRGKIKKLENIYSNEKTS